MFNFRLQRGIAQSGFTLVELLAAMAIVAILIGLLVPAVQESRRTARLMACQSNLRQWGVAVQTYADLHSGLLPRRGQGSQPVKQLTRPTDWFNALPSLMEDRPYAEWDQIGQRPQPGDDSAWICPEGQPIDPNAYPGYAVDPRIYFSYAMNMALSVWDQPVAASLRKIGPTHTMVFMADSPGPWCSTLPSTRPYSPAARHQGVANLAFMDGHVASFAGEEIGCGTGDPNFPSIRWSVPDSNWKEP